MPRAEASPRASNAISGEHAPRHEIHCVRAGLTEGQIAQYDLPTRPEKRGGARAVDLDALRPEDLRNLVRACIEQHIDDDLLRRAQAAEESERETLSDFLRQVA